MPDFGLIPQDRVGPQEAATAGAMLSMLLQGRLGWKAALTIVVAGETIAYLFTIPTAKWLGATPAWYGPIGFSFGFAGLYLSGAAMSILTEFQSQPLALVRRLLRAVRGDEP